MKVTPSKFINRNLLEKHRLGIREVLSKYDRFTATFVRPIDFDWERYFDGFDVFVIAEDSSSVKVEFTKNESYSELIS
jgi:hypothetical protein